MGGWVEPILVASLSPDLLTTKYKPCKEWREWGLLNKGIPVFISKVKLWPWENFPVTFVPLAILTSYLSGLFRDRRTLNKKLMSLKRSKTKTNSTFKKTKKRWQKSEEEHWKRTSGLCNDDTGHKLQDQFSTTHHNFIDFYQCTLRIFNSYFPLSNLLPFSSFAPSHG